MLPSYPNSEKGDFVVNSRLSQARFFTNSDRLYYPVMRGEVETAKCEGAIDVAVHWLDADKDRAMAAMNEIRFLYGRYING